MKLWGENLTKFTKRFYQLPDNRVAVQVHLVLRNYYFSQSRNERKV